MMNNLTINCKEINRCLDETNEPEIETTCSNAVAVSILKKFKKI